MEAGKPCGSFCELRDDMFFWPLSLAQHSTDLNKRKTAEILSRHVFCKRLVGEPDSVRPARRKKGGFERLFDDTIGYWESNTFDCFEAAC